MRRRRSVLDGRWISDGYPLRCSCGKEAFMLRRVGLTLLPISHRCPVREMQEAVMRTIRAEESVGLLVTPGEAARRLAEVRS